MTAAQTVRARPNDLRAEPVRIAAPTVTPREVTWSGGVIPFSPITWPVLFDGAQAPPEIAKPCII